MKLPLLFSIGLWLLCNCCFTTCRKKTDRTSRAASSTGMRVIPKETDAAISTVYVCYSTRAKKYHLKQSCGGLKRCRHQIVTMTGEEAEKIGLELCRYED